MLILKFSRHVFPEICSAAEALPKRFAGSSDWLPARPGVFESGPESRPSLQCADEHMSSQAYEVSALDPETL